ncbi:MAG TPA: excinuclease ABC subunit UvrB [Patescibacteria group bacterium]|nr:excinuclease ABC subunit UvrB [Patescibacteria group bacterium]
MSTFTLVSPFQPKGDQPKAIEKLVKGFDTYPQQTLLGVTGSGKTFTMANLIAKVNKPTLVLSHNKTLAAQLYNEFSEFFPHNKVAYFISYYDYYQPESYLPQSDTYIEKDSAINEKIEQLRLDATTSLLERRDVIVVSSISCIYGLGNPDNFRKGSFEIRAGDDLPRDDFLRRLVGLQYERNDFHLKPQYFRAKGDVVEFVPGYTESIVRVEFFGDRIEKITTRNHITKKTIAEHDRLMIYPARPFVIVEEDKQYALNEIRKELQEVLPTLGPIEQYRLKTRTEYDIEQIENLGYCKGIENYSRHFDRRKPGKPPFCLLDHFPDDFLFIIDESHATLPQAHGMYKGDVARKKNLIDYGFRLPSAYDNRPLKFKEFEKYLKHVVYTSATPGEYELKNSGNVIEQIIRPTGLVDPEISIRPIDGQIDDLFKEIKSVVKQKWRVLITTLTKRMAEELTNYLVKHDIKARYLHSEIETLDRNEILKNLRLGKFDVLVGINLLREGLDLPEVALVAILDADKEGFLRNYRSLIQTVGRAARNVEGRVIMYANRMTDSMKHAIRETDRRRKLQIQHNITHHITPKTIQKTIKEESNIVELKDIGTKKEEIQEMLAILTLEMDEAAENLEFEKAITLREKIKRLKSALRK